MKWKNRGHEFDTEGKIFQKNDSILLIGNRNDGEKLKEKLNFLNVTVDVKSLDEIDNECKHSKQDIFHKKTVVALNDEILSELKKYNQLTTCNNLFLAAYFMNTHLSVFAAYVSDKVYFVSNTIACTRKCTLNCKECIAFVPYDKNKQHRNLELIKKDLDIYFKFVNKVGLLQLSGGEIFLFPELKELITYISENFSTQIMELSTLTNGTVVPSDELCAVLKQYNVIVHMSDYTYALPHLKEQRQKCVEKLEKFGIIRIDSTMGKDAEWMSVFPPKKILNNKNYKLLEEKFQSCFYSTCHALHNKKIYACVLSSHIQEVGIYPASSTDYYDLTQLTSQNKKELIEFRLKYNEKGYVNFCKYCNGFSRDAKYSVQPAVQAKKLREVTVNYAELDKITSS